jgi:hypothetical protein
MFPPPGTDHGWTHALVLLCRRLNPVRRLRSSPRLIKRKMPKWHVKRARHADWPQPTGPPVTTIQRIQLNDIGPRTGFSPGPARLGGGLVKFGEMMPIGI